MSRFQENFLKIRTNTNANRVKKIFRKFFHVFFKYRKYCGEVSTLSNPPRYRYYRIGFDTFVITSISCAISPMGDSPHLFDGSWTTEHDRVQEHADSWHCVPVLTCGKDFPDNLCIHRFSRRIISKLQNWAFWTYLCGKPRNTYIYPMQEYQNVNNTSRHQNVVVSLSSLLCYRHFSCLENFKRSFWKIMIFAVVTFFWRNDIHI